MSDGDVVRRLAEAMKPRAAAYDRICRAIAEVREDEPMCAILTQEADKLAEANQRASKALAILREAETAPVPDDPSGTFEPPERDFTQPSEPRDHARRSEADRLADPYAGSDLKRPRKPRAKTGTSRGKASKFTPTQATEIRRRSAQGESHTYLAYEYSTSPSNIGNIVNGRDRWANIGDFPPA